MQGNSVNCSCRRAPCAHGDCGHDVGVVYATLPMPRAVSRALDRPRPPWSRQGPVAGASGVRSLTAIRTCTPQADPSGAPARCTPHFPRRPVRHCVFARYQESRRIRHPVPRCPGADGARFVSSRVTLMHVAIGMPCGATMRAFIQAWGGAERLRAQGNCVCPAVDGWRVLRRGGTVGCKLWDSGVVCRRWANVTNSEANHV